MRNHTVFKFLALALCALSLMVSILCGGGLGILAAMHVSDGSTPEQMYADQIHSNYDYVATLQAQRCASEQVGDVPRAVSVVWYGSLPADIPFAIYEGDTLLDSSEMQLEGGLEMTYTVQVPAYLKKVSGPIYSTTVDKAEEILTRTMDTMAAENADTGETTALQKTPEEGQTESAAAQAESSAFHILTVKEKEGRYASYGVEVVADTEKTDICYTVVLRVPEPDATDQRGWALLSLLWRHQNQLVLGLGLGLLAFAALAVYHCCAAGRRPGSSEVRPGGLNCLPLDLYALLVGAVCLCYGYIGIEEMSFFLRQEPVISLSYYGYGAYVCCLCFVGFCYACAAQFKTPGFYWWYHSVAGVCWSLFWKCCKLAWKVFLWLWHNGWRILALVVCWCWRQVAAVFCWLWRGIRGGLQWCSRHLVRGYALLPLTWQWLLTGALIGMTLLFGFANRNKFWIVPGVLLGVLAVIYGANVFGTLLEAAKRMRAGDLDIKVDDKFMVGGFKDFARELNGLSDVVMVAAQKQMRSERMRTELITNVSHDIKTPLTSIINYVDLLQKPHTQAEGDSYLEVLARQSSRMKRLIDDLIELSKASTGNITAVPTKLDAVETVNQALGEFTDKLTAAQLMPVFRAPKEPIYIHADGRLTWRAMSNLLSNAVKYAQAGTRLYVDMVAVDGKVCISFKNISRDPLNVSAEELMERFVRGEASRNQEGSGLGLNIAQSMMELQQGALELLVDGDLFKATLVFPQEEE